jgi:hypothetical protein
MVGGDVAVIPGNVEHEGFFPEDTEVVDVFAPPREWHGVLRACDVIPRHNVRRKREKPRPFRLSAPCGGSDLRPFPTWWPRPRPN